MGKIVGQGLGLGLGTTVALVWLLARAGRPLATPAASEVTETSAHLASHGRSPCKQRIPLGTWSRCDKALEVWRAQLEHGCPSRCPHALFSAVRPVAGPSTVSTINRLVPIAQVLFPEGVISTAKSLQSTAAICSVGSQPPSGSIAVITLLSDYCQPDGMSWR